MISYGDMLDTIEKTEPQEKLTVAEEKGGENVPEKKEVEPEETTEVDDSEDVI